MSDDWRTNPAVVALLDAALLGVIRAHHGEGSEGTRLRAAKKALFGIPSPAGRPTDPDVPELLFMAEGYAEDRGRPVFDSTYTPVWPDVDESGCRSATALARQALNNRQDYRPYNLEEKIINLVDKFTAQRAGLLRVVVGWGETEHDDVFGMHLRDLKELLDILGVPFQPPARPVRDANSLN